MAFGLDSDKELVFRWRWVPIPPPRELCALPPVVYADDAALSAVALPDGMWESFRFNFSTLAKQTPSLHFYRLVRIFNTPLLTMSHKEARYSGFAFWQGEAQVPAEGHNHAHFWFFRDAADDAVVVLEYGFDHGFRLRSAAKSAAECAARHGEIVAALRAEAATPSA